MPVTKSQLVESVAEQVDGIPMRDVETVVDTVFACMAGASGAAECETCNDELGTLRGCN